MSEPTANRSFVSRRTFLWQMMAVPAVMLLAACRQSPAGEVADATAVLQPTTLPATVDPPTTAPDTAVPPSATSELVAPTEVAAAEATLPPTPACVDDDDPTPPQTEGPFYTPDTPQRTSLLEEGLAGTRILLTGTVLATNCQPIAGALLDFWHADDAGNYDNQGYRLRGHQFADDQGRYMLETIVPGLYPGRTRHFHVKVQAPDQSVLTTQLYFPNEPQNESDGIFSPVLLMDVQEAAEGQQATFNFVLNVG